MSHFPAMDSVLQCLLVALIMVRKTQAQWLFGILMVQTGTFWILFLAHVMSQSRPPKHVQTTTTNMTHTRTQLIGNGRDMSMATPRTIGLVTTSLYPKMVTDSLQARPETMERAPTPEW